MFQLSRRGLCGGRTKPERCSRNRREFVAAEVTRLSDSGHLTFSLVTSAATFDCMDPAKLSLTKFRPCGVWVATAAARRWCSEIQPFVRVEPLPPPPKQDVRGRLSHPHRR